MRESGLQSVSLHPHPSPEHRAPSLPSHLPRSPSGLSAREKTKVRINLLEPGRGKQPAEKAPEAGAPAEPAPWRRRERPAAAGAGGRRKGEPRRSPSGLLANALGRVSGIGGKLKAGKGRTECRQRLNPLPCCCCFEHRPSPSPPPRRGLPAAGLPAEAAAKNPSLRFQKSLTRGVAEAAAWGGEESQSRKG